MASKMAAARLFISRTISKKAIAKSSYARCAVYLRNYSSSETEKVTHTGQAWSDQDYRKARFLDGEKQVNDKFAINLVSEEPATVIDNRHVYCDGGHAGMGHPKVYINLDQPSESTCGYCGRRFISKHYV